VLSNTPSMSKKAHFFVL